MTKKKKTGKPFEDPSPEKNPEIKPPPDPEDPIIVEDNPEVIPDQDPDETPPYEPPVPGEGP